ncbi:DUF1003 domain-containing protein [Nakamurella flavida]|uniref:DUF1003 domain-containing protein n=1 Tax=Nakamurella flavida TaxID=363630 RepID=A0A938YMZ7_9ACTN|nr:DUF1003 domain-containing protein [Nakamurella flavida]MBM9476194.1 DUF1003 domain-containing protein [Nakamurella flavida]MDP9777061.1 putative membrane protein [Nakamurella flavida]
MSPSENLDRPSIGRRPLLRRPDSETFGKLSEAFARYMGTPTFLLQMSAFIVAWVVWNFVGPEALRFDPYTFTFLTLLLSLQASYAAPLILLAQNRQDDRDKLALREDRRRADLNLSISEFLGRELAEIRVSTGAAPTRGFIRENARENLAPVTDIAHRLDRMEAQLDAMHTLLTASQRRG